MFVGMIFLVLDAESRAEETIDLGFEYIEALEQEAYIEYAESRLATSLSGHGSGPVYGALVGMLQELRENYY